MQSRILIAGLGLVFAMGCGKVLKSSANDAGDDDGDGNPNTPSIDLVVLTPSASVPIDGRSRIEVQVTRQGGFTGDVTIAGVGAPNGLSVTTTTLPGNADTIDVIVAGAAPLAIGGRVSFSLEGTGTGIAAKSVMLTDVPVTGKPGSLDDTFGAGASGIGTISFGADDDGTFFGLDVVGGKIVATGAGTGGLGEIRMATIRFDANGLVDPTWNGGALSRSAYPPNNSNDAAIAVATGRQTDGRSIIIGHNTNRGTSAPCPCTPDVAFARFSLDGKAGGVDFGNVSNAQQTIELGGVEVVNDGLVLPNSKIVAVGSKDGQLMVMQAVPSGGLDTSFVPPAGFDRVVLGASSQANAVIADAMDRLVVAGTFTAGGQTDLVVLRYLPTGIKDASFGNNGQITVTGPGNETTVRIRMFGDKLLLASNAVDAGVASFRVRRFLTNGMPDTTFGNGGLAEAPVADVRDLVILPDGGIVGLANNAGKARLVRLTSKGVVDDLLGGGGTVDLFIGDAGNPGSIVVYDDHRIVVGGGNQGGTPGPGTFGIVARVWM